jgi:hypothetical protein
MGREEQLQQDDAAGEARSELATFHRAAASEPCHTLSRRPEQPGEFNRRVAEFLASLDAGAEAGAGAS